MKHGSNFRNLCKQQSFRAIVYFAEKPFQKIIMLQVKYIDFFYFRAADSSHLP